MNEDLLELPPDNPPLAEGNEPAQSASESPTLEDRLAALEEENRRLAERLASQNVPQAVADPQAVAHAVLGALTYRDSVMQQRANAESQRQPLPRPALSEEDRDNILADPDFLFGKVDEVAQYYAQSLYQHLVPVVQGFQVMAPITETATELLAEVATDRARALADRSGVPADEFERLLPRAREVLAYGAAGDQVKLRTWLMNPQTIAEAVRIARNEGGVPTQRQDPPPSIGSARRPTRPAPPSKSQDVLDMERALGITFKPESLAEIQRRRGGA
jgi:hypothetical protein